MSRAEEGRAEDLHLKLILHHLLHLQALLTAEELVQVVGVAKQVGRGKDRPGGYLFRDVLGSDVAHFEVVALKRYQFCSLAEQRRVQVHLDLEIAGDLLGELVHHVGANVLVGKHGCEADVWWALCPGRQDSAGSYCATCAKQLAAID